MKFLYLENTNNILYIKRAKWKLFWWNLFGKQRLVKTIKTNQIVNKFVDSSVRVY